MTLKQECEWTPCSLCKSPKVETEKRVRKISQKDKPERYEARGRLNAGLRGKDPMNEKCQALEAKDGPS